MTSELKIKKFKKISEEIHLQDFANINYFVGENGSGKTSILNSISFLMDGLNARQFFSPDSIVKYSYGEKTQYIYWNESNPNKTESIGNLEPHIYTIISNVENEKGQNNIKGRIKINEPITITNQDTLDKVNDFLSGIGQEKLTAEKILDQSNPFSQDNGRLIFKNDKETVEPRYIADGLRALYNLNQTLSSWMIKFTNPNQTYFIIIEEPENNLHPKFQKAIPNLLDQLYNSIDSDIAKNVFFFISTHSPFIISSASKFLNQKIYPLEEGKLLEVNSVTNTWSQTNSHNGYKGSECAYVVSKMLGADITDIGYPENYCILEEYSLQKILDTAREKGIIKNIQFVSASGVNRSIGFADTIYEIEKLNTLIKCNPYYFDKYYLILDNTAEIQDKGLHARLETIKNRLSERFIELSLNSLEDYYLNISQELHDAFASESEAEKDKFKKGLIKAKYASEISNLIVNKESFTKLFNGELDFLLS